VTLVVDEPGDAPRIHLLVIGVGSYRHLPGGADPMRHDTLGLRQLSGPPLSALAFTEFVVSRLRHPTARIGTVELLLSPAQSWAGRQGPTPIELPNSANVVTAFEAWYERCEADPDGVALFYFCGHGVQRGTPLLLAEDFGRSRLSMLENAIDILATFYGMAACPIRTQYFFIDACREIPQQLLGRLNGTPRVLIDREVFGEDRDCGLLFATSGGHRAYGVRGTATRFTEALIKAWEGLGGRQDSNRWVVEFGGLQYAVTALLQRDDPKAPSQRPQSYGLAGNAVLQVCPGPPVVPLRVACRPPGALQAGDATASLARLGSRDLEPLLRSEEGWLAELPADVYQLDVDVTPPYHPASQRITAWPPYCDVEVPLT